jgi:ABC-type branched-subunit amino acid transport system ATPase component
MKILAGVITDYEGSIELNGQESRFKATIDAEESGIRIIHQELNLVPDLSVAANIFLGEEITGRFGVLDADPGIREQLGESYRSRAADHHRTFSSKDCLDYCFRRQRRRWHDLCSITVIGSDKNLAAPGVENGEPQAR